MTIQDKYDELENIVITLNTLIDDLSIRDYIDDLREIKYNAEREMEEIEPKLQEEWDAEKRKHHSQYEHVGRYGSATPQVIAGVVYHQGEEAEADEKRSVASGGGDRHGFRHLVACHRHCSDQLIMALIHISGYSAAKEILAVTRLRLVSVYNMLEGKISHSSPF